MKPLLPLASYVRIAAAAVLVCAASDLVLAQKGKPAPPPPPPPILYGVKYFAAPQEGGKIAVRDMNQSRVVVGNYYTTNGAFGFLYDPSRDPDAAMDLNDLVVGVPEGWIIQVGLGINDHGVIAATIIKAGSDVSQPDFEAHGVLIDTTGDIPWQAVPVPDAYPGIRISSCRKINNRGEVLASFTDEAGQSGAFVYQSGLFRDDELDGEPTLVPATLQDRYDVTINDPIDGPAQVAGKLADGRVFRFTLGDTEVETFSSLADPNDVVEAINSFGVFCGRARVRKSKGSQFVHRPYRFDPDNQSSPTLLGTESEHSMVIGNDINNAEDVIAGKYFFHSSAGTLKLDNLVTGTPDDVAFWLNTYWKGAGALSERDPATGFPFLAGTITNGGATDPTFGFLLTPVAP